MEEHALVSMGYRKQKNLWLKPVGWSLYVFDGTKLTNYFKGKTELLIWSSKQYSTEYGADLNWLKHAENTIAHKTWNDSSFEFVTNEQLIELSLGL